MKFENTVSVLQCTPTGNCGAKDLSEMAALPPLQLPRTERLNKAHCVSAVNFCFLLFLRTGIGRVAGSVRFGTVAGCLVVFLP